jgi:hypothetical protein
MQYGAARLGTTMDEKRREATAFDVKVGQACSVVVGWGIRYAVPVLLGAVALTIGSLWYAANHLTINSNIDAMFSSDVPFRHMVYELRDAFPGIDQPIIIVIDAATPEAAHDTAAALSDRLAAQPALFQGVFAPGVGTFFDTHGLLYLDVDTLATFSDRVIEALPFMGVLARDPTLNRLLRLVDDALTREDPGRLTQTRLPDFVQAVSTIIEAPLQNESENFSWRSWAPSWSSRRWFSMRCDRRDWC